MLCCLVMGIGISPGAINYVTGHAIFEATHGTAPDIAGKTLLIHALFFYQVACYLTISDGQKLQI